MTPGEPSDLPDALMADLLEVLDLVILERLSGGAMARVGDRPPPAWFAETFYKEHPRQAVTLLEAFPVLDGFMSEAGPFWSRPPTDASMATPVSSPAPAAKTCRWP